MTQRFREPDRLGRVLRRLDKSAQLGDALDQEAAIPRESLDQVAAIPHSRLTFSRRQVGPVWRQRREVVSGELDDPRVLAAGKKYIFEKAGGDEAESYVPEARGDLPGAGPGYVCLVELAEKHDEDPEIA